MMSLSYSMWMRGIDQVLYPFAWFAAYHAPLAVGLVWVALGKEQFGKLEPGRRLRLALGIGLGLTALFVPAGLMHSGFMSIVAGIVAWVALGYAMDFYFDMDIETGHRAVGTLLAVPWFAWLLVGALLTLTGYLR